MVKREIKFDELVLLVEHHGKEKLLPVLQNIIEMTEELAEHCRVKGPDWHDTADMYMDLAQKQHVSIAVLKGMSENDLRDAADKAREKGVVLQNLEL